MFYLLVLRCKVAWIVVLMLLTVGTLPAIAGTTLENIKTRGELRCGVNTSLVGFSSKNAIGKWTGLDVDVCRAIAAAVLGSDQKVKYVPLTATQRLTALQQDEIDILSRNTTFTLARDASMGLRQTVVTYYDGQGFMVPVKNKIERINQLRGQAVCVQSGTTTEKNLMEFSRSNNLNLQIQPYEKLETASGNYFLGLCAAFTADASSLASTRSANALYPKEHQILSELISKEPLGPLVRRGDEEWFNAVKWVIYSLIEAEERGLTQASLDPLKPEGISPAAKRWLNNVGSANPAMGLEKGWTQRALQATGNYGDIFSRNLGDESTLKLTRGLNKLWNQGGLHYALPFY